MAEKERRRHNPVAGRKDRPAPEMQELEDLKSALNDLTVKVNRLAALQAEARRKS